MNVDIYVDAILLYIIFKSLEKIILTFTLFFFKPSFGLYFFYIGHLFILNNIYYKYLSSHYIINNIFFKKIFSIILTFFLSKNVIFSLKKMYFFSNWIKRNWCAKIYTDVYILVILSIYL